MARREKVTVWVAQRYRRSDGSGKEEWMYVVSKVQNAVDPQVYDTLTRSQVEQLIANGVTVNVSGD